MIAPVLKKTIFISLLGHITAFGIFSFSFGSRLPDLSRMNVSFWGSALKNYDFTARRSNFNKPVKAVFSLKPAAPALEKDKSREYIMEERYFKPFAHLSMQDEKAIFARDLSENPLPKIRKQSVVMLYPKLPYHFNLYFKDRQLVHIQLDYNIIPRGKVNSVVILQRRISSGNPEVDLLCMRYINLYLSMQQDRFIPNKWQTVKIELEPKK